ncbi:PKD domain-containing protein [Lutimonas zeaxanthinifaciens]|uniref:PKD domain-containing protein n=1 Tax=Lutimonas zeaxanthinifaciens TaxID=3060215 RepID=UPI00265CDF26|nr:PKD domain-containing protein [Lutimonas sp. YSD2104]WKK67287.1 PKD domain-containing protein [Lutimonas sp. YSD2104]
MVQLNAQYATADFSSSNLITDGLNAPGRMAIDSNDDIYVIDAIEKNIVKYDVQGNSLGTINTEFIPLSVAINNKDQLFAGDQTTGTIYTVDSNGSKSEFYTGLSFPASMVFGLDNILYVIDSHQKKVVGLNVSGNLVNEFTYSTFTFPTGIAFDKQNNHIIVSEHGGVGEDVQTCGGGSMSWGTTGPLTTIYIFDIEGNLINDFGCFGTKNGLFHRIQGITVGACGNIYAVDPYLGRVSVFDDNGNYITKFGQQGDSMGEFNLPLDIVFTSDNQAVVSSMNKGNLDVFSINNVLPTATITSTDQTICANSEATVTINFTGNGPWTFNYTVDGANPVEITTDQAVYDLTVSNEGLYEVSSLVDTNGIAGTCFTGATNIKVDELPTATFSAAEISICGTVETGVDVQFTGLAPWTFTYTIDGLNPIEISTTESLYTIPAEQSGIYEILSLTDAGCSVVNLIEKTDVLIFAMPTATITNESDIAFFNPGEFADITIAFTGTAPYTFTYSRGSGIVEEFTITTNENPYTLSVNEIGVYEILDISDLYCSNMNWQGYIDVLHNTLPNATIPTTSICENESEGFPIYFTGSPPWTFTYTIDGLNPVEITTSNNPYLLAPSSSGVYELVSFYDSKNTMGTVSGSATVYPEVTADYVYEVANYDVKFINNSENADSHNWDFGDGNFSSEESPTHTYDSSGYYTVVYTATNENCGTSEFTETIEVIGNVLSIDGKFKDNPVSFYPNPSNGDFTIKITPPDPIVGNIRITITSSQGQTIYTEDFNPIFAVSYEGSIYKEIHLNYFNKGIYIVNVASDNFAGNAKLILKD